MVKNIFCYSLYAVPGMLAVGNDVRDSLWGAFISSAAIQTFAVGYVGLNYQHVKQKMNQTTSRKVAILPSAIAAKQYLSPRGGFQHLVAPSLMRLPLMMSGPLLAGNSLLQSFVAGAIGTALMEWSVISYVQGRLHTRAPGPPDDRS